MRRLRFPGWAFHVDSHGFPVALRSKGTDDPVSREVSGERPVGRVVGQSNRAAARRPEKLVWLAHGIEDGRQVGQRDSRQNGWQ